MPPDTILIHMRKLHLNPYGIKPMFMQDSRHCMPKTVTGSTPLISQQLYNLIHTFLTYRLSAVVSSNENVRIVAGDRL